MLNVSPFIMTGLDWDIKGFHLRNGTGKKKNGSKHQIENTTRRGVNVVELKMEVMEVLKHD